MKPLEARIKKPTQLSRPVATEANPVKPLVDPKSAAVDLELSDATKQEIHKASEDFQDSLQSFIAPKSKEENIWSKLKKQEWIHWVHKNLFDDDCFARKILSLENELAEGLDPTFEQLKAPKGVRNGVYRVLWAMTFVTTGFRSLYEAIDQGKGIAGIKKIVQDGVSVVALTTALARGLNWLQEKIYNSAKIPLLLKNTIRPFFTIIGCVKLIPIFDRIAGEPAGEYAVKFVEGLMNKSTNSKPSE